MENRKNVYKRILAKRLRSIRTSFLEKSSELMREIQICNQDLEENFRMLDSSMLDLQKVSSMGCYLFHPYDVNEMTIALKKLTRRLLLKQGSENDLWSVDLAITRPDTSKATITDLVAKHILIMESLRYGSRLDAAPRKYENLEKV